MPSLNSQEHRELAASATDAGARLDRFVAAQCPELSRTRIQELIEAGLVLVDGRAGKAAQRVRGGERISIQVQPRPAPRAEAEAIPLDVLYEDDDLIAVDKPAGMTVHAGAGNARGTLVNALLGRGQKLSRGGDALRPGIVHRLDKDTSGVILIAKNDFAHAKLGEAFQQRSVKKSYIALVEGALKQDRGRIELAIGRDPKRRTRMTARRSMVLGKSREARTDWRALLRVGNTTLVEADLHTGRTHQIRVHFAALHHPVVGDALYGAQANLRVGKTAMPRLDRNFLHAARLAFTHPRSGSWIELRAPLPPKLREFLERLGTVSGEPRERIDAALAPYL